jgi:acyl-CoA synthetase (AMP-forming)/AMP-acid ligase II
VENGALASLWEVDSNGALYIVGDASNNDGYGMALTTTWFSGEHAVTSGKIALKNVTKPVLTFDVKASGITSLQVMGAKAGGAPELLQQVTLTDQWKSVKVALDNVKDGRYVRLSFVAEFYNPSTEDWMTGDITSWGDALFLDNIQVADDSVSGISDLQKAQDASDARYFNLSGQPVSNSQKGVKIVRMSDGTTKKLLVK